MHKFVFLLALAVIYCQSNPNDKSLINNWVNTIQRDQVVTDSEYNVIKTEPAIDTTLINISKKTITINFKLRHNNDSIRKNDASIHIYYTKDSLKNYDTTVSLSYTKDYNKLLININNKKYRVVYTIQGNRLILNEIDKIPFFIKNTDLIFNKEYYQYK